MIIDESIVIAFSVLLVAFFLFNYILKIIKTSISQHRDGINTLINDSYYEKETSDSRYAQAMKKNKTIEDKIAQILNVARLEAKLITNKERKALEAAISRKRTQEQMKLARQNDLVIEELKEKIISTSAHYSYKLTLLKAHDKLSQNKIFDLAIQHMPNKLH